MIDPERPPLDAITYEVIAQSLHKVDQCHWPKIAEFRIAAFIPLSEPVPPRVPGLLLSTIRQYASDLFKAEAEYYQRFLSDPHCRAWLSKLESRVLVRVLDTVEKIHGADPKKMLMVHGLEHRSMEESLREMLWEMGTRYASKMQTEQATELIAPAHEQIETSGTTGQTGSTFKEAVSNRERIDTFIRKMAEQNLKINRKVIWKAAGYMDRTEFERFQRGEGRNKSATAAFNRVLGMEHEDFMKLVGKKP